MATAHTSASGVVIVGAGHAGVETALGLREHGYGGPITLLGDEPQPPYERPPLSKAWLHGQTGFDDIVLRAAKAYEDNDIAVRTGCRVHAVDAVEQTVTVDDGETIVYEHLVLATGATPRALPIPGGDLAGVHHLHTWSDASRLREHLDEATSVVVIGGGFIGLEAAAAARKHGLTVRVIEAGTRVMQRAVTVTVSTFYQSLHRDAGIVVSTEVVASALTGSNGHVDSVVLSTGEIITADLVVVGVGIVPNVELAQAAGLHVDNGVIVDDQLVTSDPHISAIGDCANFPSFNGAGRLRLESVQNASDQGRVVAKRLTGTAGRYMTVPWFWTDQLGCKLQMAGLTSDSDEHVVIGNPEEKKFTVLSWRDGIFTGGESVNRPGDHIAIRRLLARNSVQLDPATASDPDFTLKSYLKSLDTVITAS